MKGYIIRHLCRWFKLVPIGTLQAVADNYETTLSTLYALLEEAQRDNLRLDEELQQAYREMVTRE